MDTHQDVEDLQQAHDAGRPVRAHGPYRVLLGDELLNFRPAIIAEPEPTAQQILEAAGVTPVLEYMLSLWRRDGQLEVLRADERIDLRKRGVDKFVVFKGDRIYRLELDGHEFDWGAGRIQGRVLKILAKVDLATYGVWQEVPGHDDRAIGDDQFADLTGPGVECFFTGIVKTTEGR